MLGSHNSFTYLKSTKKIFNWFSFLWKCQTKTIEQQKDSKVKYFDIRVRFNKRGRWQVCHGIVDLELEFKSLEDILDMFCDSSIRLILERGDDSHKYLFKIRINELLHKYPQISYAAIKKNWEVLYDNKLNIFDYTYQPWNSGKSFWENIKKFNFFSTIKRFAKKHNPIINDIVIKDSTNIYFIDYA